MSPIPAQEAPVYCSLAVPAGASAYLILAPVQLQPSGYCHPFPSAEKQQPAVQPQTSGYCLSFPSAGKQQPAEVHNNRCCALPLAPAPANLELRGPPAAPPRQLGVASAEGQIWSLSREPQGSRTVQSALDEARDDQARTAMAAEMRGHVLEAVQCPHANYVLQKFIVSLGPQALQFVVDEILSPHTAQAVQVAKHKYGCRILQRLLEHCRPDQLVELVAELTDCAVTLARHPYANFVMQHLFEHGSQEQRHLLVRRFEGHAKALGKDDHGRAVLSKALVHSTSEDGATLARALLQEQGLLTRMACTRHGHAAVKSVLLVLQGPELARAHEQLLEGGSKLRSSRYGRTVVARMVEGTQEPLDDSSYASSESGDSSSGYA